MKTILCFGDSNTYGLNPHHQTRFPDTIRWTGLLQQMLPDWRIAEEGLCGRTTIFPDPIRTNRTGADALPMLLETHAPLDAVILMLGTNDCKTCFHNTPEQIGQGITQLIQQIRRFSKTLPLLLISPIHLADGVGEVGFDPAFDANSVAVSHQLKAVYTAIAQQEHCRFLAASDVALPSMADREHMDEVSHSKLAKAIYDNLNGWLF